LAVRAPELAQVVALEKYGMPPDVPATVNAGAVVGFATLMIPPVNDTLVTVPLPLPPPLGKALALAPFAPYARMVPVPVPPEDDVTMRT
jgi:hypothetical protein